LVTTEKSNTVKSEFNDHPRDPKIVAVVDRRSLHSELDVKIVVVVDKWSLAQVDCIYTFMHVIY